MGNNASKIKYDEREEQPQTDYEMAGSFPLFRDEQSWTDFSGFTPFEEEVHIATLHVKTETSAAVDTYLREQLPPNIFIYPTSSRLSYPRWPCGSKLTMLFSEIPDVLTARSAIQRVEKTPQLDEFRDAWLYNPSWASERDRYMYYNPGDHFLPSPRELALNELSRQYHERQELRAWIRAEVERREAERQRVNVDQTVQGEHDNEYDGSPMSFRCIGANRKETRYRVVEGPATEAPATPVETLAVRLAGVSSAPPFRALRLSSPPSTSLPMENIFLLSSEEVRLLGQPCLQQDSPNSHSRESSETASDSLTQFSMPTPTPASASSSTKVEEQKIETHENQFSKMPIRKPEFKSNLLPASMYLEYDHARNAALGAEIDDIARDWVEVTECASSDADSPPPRQWRPARADTPYPGLRRVEIIADLRRVVKGQRTEPVTASPLQRRAFDFERQQKSRIECIDTAATHHASPKTETEPVPSGSIVRGELVGNPKGLLKTAFRAVFERYYR